MNLQQARGRRVRHGLCALRGKISSSLPTSASSCVPSHACKAKLPCLGIAIDFWLRLPILGGVHLLLRSFAFAALVAHMRFLSGHLRFSFLLACWLFVSPAQFFNSLLIHCLVSSYLAVCALSCGSPSLLLFFCCVLAGLLAASSFRLLGWFSFYFVLLQLVG